MTTIVDDFIGDLDGGVFSEKLSAVLSEVAGAAIDHNKKGKVIIELSISRIGTSYQVNVEHVLKYERPTSRGDVKERNKTSTPMHVGSKGAMSFFPESQGTMFDKRGGVTNGEQRFPNNVDPETGELRK